MNTTATCTKLRESSAHSTAVLGFDTFVDRICHQASGLGEGTIDSVTEFGNRLIARNNRSGSIVLNGLEERSGGNMPNTALVLSSLGASVDCIGAFGKDGIMPVFHKLVKNCRLFSYADPATCMAIEFGQSKLFFGEMQALDAMTWEELLRIIPLETMIEVYGGAEFIGLFNWAELKSTQRLWDGLLKDVMPRLPIGKRTIFVDFSDVSGRSERECMRAFETLRAFRQYGRVYISANALESEMMDPLRVVEMGAADVFITHKKDEAILYSEGKTEHIPTRFCEKPVMLTGGGDSFNGGFMFGLMSGLTDEECVKCGHAAAGCIIRTGAAPTKEQLLAEMELSSKLWDENETNG